MSPRQRILTILFCYPVVVALTFSLAGHLQAHFWVANMLAQFQLFALFGGLVFLALALLLRIKAGILFSLLLAASGAVAVAPLMLHEMQAPQASGPSAKIINYNVLSISPHQEVIAGWIRAQQPDIVALVEANYRWAFTVAGLQDILPHQAVIDHDVHFGMMLLSRYPMENVKILERPGNMTKSIMADVALPIGTVRFIIAHPVTPMRPFSRIWRDIQIQGYAEYISASPNPVVLMGDFNATPWTSSYLGLVKEQQLYGSSLYPSWPSKRHIFGIPIDQIVAGKGAVVSHVTTGPAHHSDHRARVAELRLIPRQDSR